MDTRVLALPKLAKRVFAIFARFVRFVRLVRLMPPAWNHRGDRKLNHQLHLAIRAAGKSLPVLGFALWAEHGGEQKVYYTPSSRSCKSITPHRCAPASSANGNTGASS